MMMTGTLNGRIYMDEVANNEIVRLGDLEVWEFTNGRQRDGHDGRWWHPHPMHIHGMQFQVLELGGSRTARNTRR
jgi:FtsP/CotA-like multicopper oxidase with cupredoxin domain